MRFEAPDSRNRWDSPVFTVNASDSVPFDQVHDMLYHRQPPPPNLSTLPVSNQHILLFATVQLVLNMHYRYSLEK